MARSQEDAFTFRRRTFVGAAAALAAGPALIDAGHGAYAAASSFAVSSDADFFNNVNLGYPGLSATAALVAAKDIPGAVQSYVSWLNSRTTPNYFFSPADRGRFTASMAADPARSASIMATADDLYGYVFTFLGETRTYTAGKVAWTGPDEWVNVLNRFQWLRTLALASYISGDSKYIARGYELIADWISKCLVISAPTTSPSPWRALEVGIRTGAWLDFLALSRGQAGSTTLGQFAVMRSLMEHGRYLAQYQSTFQPGNWQANAAGPFAWLGIMVPDWLQAADWSSTGRLRTEQQLISATNADGFQSELATFYHEVVFTAAAQTLVLARANGLPDFSASGLARLSGAYNVVYQLRYPNGVDPMLGDGPAAFDTGTRFVPDENLSAGAVLINPAYKRLSPATASVDLALLFGWSLVDSYSALPVPTTSRSPLSTLTASNICVLRSGQTADTNIPAANSLQLTLDASGVGIGGHSHPDALQALVYAYGRSLLIDPGYGTSYDRPEYASYFKKTVAHNTVLVDGADQPRAANGSAGVGISSAAALGTLDYARGHLDDYAGIDHVREIGFIGDEYWVVRDVLTAHDDGDRPAALSPAAATASSQHNTSWAPANAIDGKPSTAWSSAESTSPVADDWIAVRFATPGVVSELIVWPRVYGSSTVHFPVDFVLETSMDGTQWTPIPGQAYTGYPEPPASANGIKFALAAPVVAEYVRIHSSKRRLFQGIYYCQVAEIAAYGSTTTAPSAIAVQAAGATTHHGSYVPANAIDGNTTTFWSSEQAATADTPITFFVDAGRASTIGQVTLVPRQLDGAAVYFPVDFSIESSLDGTNWSAIPGLTFTNYAQPATGEVVFTFAATVQARFIRISVTRMSTYDNKFYAQFSEVRIAGYVSYLRQLDQLWHFWPGALNATPDGYRTGYSGTANAALLVSSTEKLEKAVESGLVANDAANDLVPAPYARFTLRSIPPASFETVIYPDRAGATTAVSILGRIYAIGSSAIDAVGLKIAIGSRVDCVYFKSAAGSVTFSDGFVATEAMSVRTL